MDFILVAVGTLVVSTILIGGFHFFKGRRMVKFPLQKL
jgi:hypothetical protein